MKRSIHFAILACLFLSGRLFSQNRPAAPEIKPDAPDWVHMMTAENPNVFDIGKAYTDFYRERPFVKNSYTQFFKRWMQWSRPYLQGDGTLRFPTAEESQLLENQLILGRKKTPGDSDGQKSAGAWTFFGPKKHFDTDGTKTAISRHTNIYSFDIAPSNANILYAGGESGGLWKTLDKGMNWSLLTAGITHGAFGAVKIHPTNPSTVWAGTQGKIVKTTDGGTTWATVLSVSNLWVNEFAVSATNPDIVLAASEQGLYRSTNGGTNWTLLFSNFTWTVKQKTGDGTTFFAVRKSGTTSHFIKSTDSGATWTNTATGWFAPPAGQTVTGAIIAPCPSNASKLYAFLCGEGGNLGGYIGVFKSADGGATWSNTHPTNAIGQPYSIPNHVNLMDANGIDWFNQGFYDMAIVVNPANENEIITGGCSWWKSANGGQTWQPFGGYVGSMPGYRHPDMQALAWLGSDLWISTDGGIDYSSDGGATIAARHNGISGSDLWGFDSGWNEDVLAGGRYHNGNMGYYEGYPAGQFLALGGAEAATGYVNPGPGRKTYHSDIGGYSLPLTLAGEPQYFGVGVWPNESYAYYQNSEMVWHPNCWSIVFLGKENKLWKSLDGGSSFSAVYTFPGNADNLVFDIEISRSNPQIMYVSQWGGTDDRIFRSADGGATFVQCTALPLPNNNDRLKLALSDANPNHLWVAITYGSNGKKVYKTTDGGATWVNQTSALLDGKTVQNLLFQCGTNGGVYIGTTGGVFYRNNTHADWQPFSDGLPLSAQTNRLKPFYKLEKIRLGGWGFGVWESPLFEPSVPKANAMANRLYAGCQRDTFYFDDYSAVQHVGASWAWQFPGASWTSATNIRSPKAFFPGPGNYQAIMALTYGGTTTYDTLALLVGTECAADSIPGKAVRLGGNNDPGSVVISPLNLNTNTFTVTAWVKPDGIQPEYSGIFMHDGNQTGGFNFIGSQNHLGYHWPGGAWWWDSGLAVPSGAWSHVAMVVAPTSVTLYLNGVASAHTGQTLDKINFTSNCQLGTYKNWGDRNVKGDIEEVCVFNRSLTQNEIREKMHLRKIPTAENKLEAYFQFNETAGNAVYDRSKTRHAGLNGSAVRIPSTVAVGPGGAYRRQVNAGGTHGFSARTNLTAYWPTTGTFPLGECVATRINLAPDQLPNADPVSRAYWVVYNYGVNQSFTPPTKIYFQKIGNVPSSTTAGQYKLFRRPANGEGAVWTVQDNAGELRTAGTDGALTFSTNNNITAFGSQYIITKPVAGPEALATTDLSENRSSENPGGFSDQKISEWVEVSVSPNPVAKDGLLNVRANLSGEAVFRLFDAKGQAVRVQKFSGAAAVPMAGLAAGVYFYRVENEVFMGNGRVILD